MGGLYQDFRAAGTGVRARDLFRRRQRALLAGRGVGMLIHVVGHAPAGAVPFALGEVADRFWLKLRDAFPEALAACLLPAQVHLLVPSSFEPRGTSEVGTNGGPAIGALRLLLGALSWTLGGGTAW